MMTYFEVRHRLDNLREFRRLYMEYLSFINREKNPAATVVRSKMEPYTTVVVDSLRRVKLGAMLTHQAPAHGGKRMRINLIRAIFRDQVIRQYGLDEYEPMRILESGISRYKTMLWKQTIQLFNPFFWLFHAVEFLAHLPLTMMRKAGFDISKIEESTGTKVWVVVFQIAVFYAVIHWTGLTEWFLSNLIAL